MRRWVTHRRRKWQGAFVFVDTVPRPRNSNCGQNRHQNLAYLRHLKLTNSAFQSDTCSRVWTPAFDSPALTTTVCLYCSPPLSVCPSSSQWMAWLPPCLCGRKAERAQHAQGSVIIVIYRVQTTAQLCHVVFERETLIKYEFRSPMNQMYIKTLFNF